MNNDAYKAQAELKDRALHSDPVVTFTKKQFAGMSRDEAKRLMRAQLREAMKADMPTEPSNKPFTSALAAR